MDVVLELIEYNWFLKGLFSWVGFKIEYIFYENCECVVGEIFWFFWKLFNYLIDGIVNFFDVLLIIVLFIGVLFCVGFGIVILFIILWVLLFGDFILGWFFMVLIFLFIGGI